MFTSIFYHENNELSVIKSQSRSIRKHNDAPAFIGKKPNKKPHQTAGILLPMSMCAKGSVLSRPARRGSKESNPIVRERTSGIFIRKRPNKKPHQMMGFLFGAPAGIRIPDTLIKSQVLYRLSYRGVVKSAPKYISTQKYLCQ